MGNGINSDINAHIIIANNAAWSDGKINKWEEHRATESLNVTINLYVN